MAFWGVEVKPGKPFRHPPSDDHGKRLHISQATLGIGTAIGKSVVQCNVGENTPVLLCSLRPDTAESSQLNLEFQESHEVVFSVLGPLSVHLTGYYVQPPGDEIEPPGEDIANTDDELSASSSNEEDEYEDSFINDSDPGIVPSSPASGDEAEKTFDRKETKDVKTGRRRIKKKYQLIDSPSEEQGIAKALQPLDKHTHEEEGTVIESETNKVKQREIGDNLTPKQDVPAMEDAEPKSSPPYSNEVTSENEAKSTEEEAVPKVVKPLGIIMGLPVPKNEQKNANGRKKTRSTIRENTGPQCGNEAGNLEKDVPLPLPIEENQKQEKSDRAENVKKSKRKRKNHFGVDKVLEAEGPTIESANVKNLLLKTNQGNSKTENDEEHNQEEAKNNNLEERTPMLNENEKLADNEKKTRSTIRENTGPQCGNEAGNLEKDVPLPLPIEENQKQEKSDRAENVKKSKKKRKKHFGVDKVLEAEGPTIESANVKNLLLETNQGNSKTENDEEHNQEEAKNNNLEERTPMLNENEKLADNEAGSVRKTKKKRKKLSGEAEGATIEGENVKNLLLETTNPKTENDEKCKGESVDDKFEKKKRRKKLKSKEKVEAVPE